LRFRGNERKNNKSSTIQKKKKSAVSEIFFAAESDLGIEIIHAATVKPWLIWTFIYSHRNRG
jgi:hypothetical protein